MSASLSVGENLKSSFKCLDNISFVVFPEESCVKNAAQRAKGLDNINNFLFRAMFGFFVCILEVIEPCHSFAVSPQLLTHRALGAVVGTAWVVRLVPRSRCL